MLLSKTKLNKVYKDHVAFDPREKSPLGVIARQAKPDYYRDHAQCVLELINTTKMSPTERVKQLTYVTQLLLMALAYETIPTEKT